MRRSRVQHITNMATAVCYVPGLTSPPLTHPPTQPSHPPTHPPNRRLHHLTRVRRGEWERSASWRGRVARAHKRLRSTKYCERQANWPRPCPKSLLNPECRSRLKSVREADRSSGNRHMQGGGAGLHGRLLLSVCGDSRCIHEAAPALSESGPSTSKQLNLTLKTATIMSSERKEGGKMEQQAERPPWLGGHGSRGTCQTRRVSVLLREMCSSRLHLCPASVPLCLVS